MTVGRLLIFVYYVNGAVMSTFLLLKELHK